MKTILSALLLLFIGSAANVSVKLPTTSNDSPARVGDGKIHVLVLKTYQKKMADGSYQKVVEKICDKDGKAPVYDDSQTGSIVVGPDDSVECKTQLNSGAANIIMTGVIGLLHGVDPLEIGSRQNYRNFGESVWVQTGTKLKQFPFASAMVPDLNANSIIMTAQGDQFEVDLPGGAVTDETITVVMKFEDK